MLRLLLLFVLAALPLFASAHGGHHSAARQARAPVAADANGTLRAIVAAPSRCPGGEDGCCCHDATCTPPYQPVAIHSRPAEVCGTAGSGESISCGSRDTARLAPFPRHAPRGPPARS